MFSLWVGKIPWRREWLPTPVFLPGEFYGQKSLVGWRPHDGPTNTEVVGYRRGRGRREAAFNRRPLVAAETKGPEA